MPCVINRLDMQQRKVKPAVDQRAARHSSLAGKVAVIAAGGPRGIQRLDVKAHAQACTAGQEFMQTLLVCVSCNGGCKHIEAVQ